MKVNFRARLMSLKGRKFILVPASVADGIADDENIEVSILTSDVKSPVDKIGMDRKIYEWLSDRAKESPDHTITVSPRTVAMQFKITDKEALILLSTLEVDGMVRSEDSGTGILYRLIA